jgi:hypothetical protein
MISFFPSFEYRFPALDKKLGLSAWTVIEANFGALNAPSGITNVVAGIEMDVTSGKFVEYVIVVTDASKTTAPTQLSLLFASVPLVTLYVPLVPHPKSVAWAVLRKPKLKKAAPARNKISLRTLIVGG